jgi:hypothetical protein
MVSKLKKKMGRPKKEIDKKAFEALCGIQCTRSECCQFFNVSDKLLDRWCKATYTMTFASIFKIKRGTGVISLRRSGFHLAKTNGSVYIFLAKNYLGLRDQPVNDDDIPTASPVTVVIKVEDAAN